MMLCCIVNLVVDISRYFENLLVCQATLKHALAEHYQTTWFDVALLYSSIGIGARYVILVTNNEAKNEAGCYQNCITSHFNCLSGFASCNLVILKIT